VNVNINTGVEGLFPFVTPNWPAQNPALREEASPWQFWDPNHPLALAEVQPGITAHMASASSNPDMSSTKARAYIDSIMGYLTPRMFAALELGNACAFTGIDSPGSVAPTVDVFPNPASDHVTISSASALVRRYEILDINGRVLRTGTVNTDRLVLGREGLAPGAYIVKLHFDAGTVSRKLVLD
jgi:hypothetical protein